jgi:hypothetical protein
VHLSRARRVVVVVVWIVHRRVPSLVWEHYIPTDDMKTGQRRICIRISSISALEFYLDPSARTVWQANSVVGTSVYLMHAFELRSFVSGILSHGGGLLFFL